MVVTILMRNWAENDWGKIQETSKACLKNPAITVTSYLYQNYSISWNKNLIQFEGQMSQNILSTGDRQFCSSGFIKLIAAIVYRMKEVCPLVPVLHFVYVGMQ